MQAIQQKPRYPDISDIDLCGLPLRLNTDDSSYREGLSLTNPELTPISSQSKADKASVTLNHIKEKVYAAETVINSMLKPIEKLSVTQLRPDLKRIMTELMQGASFEIENRKRGDVSIALLSSKDNLEKLQAVIHDLSEDLAEREDVYTFETHPFYSKIRDYSKVEMPDQFEPSGEAI